VTATEQDPTGPGRYGTAEVINMYDEELVRDPYGGYARIRERTPLARGVMPGVEPAWVVTRYDDVKTVLADPRFVNDQANVPGPPVRSLREQVLRAHEIPPEYMKYRLLRMDAFDGAEHSRLRGLVARAFTVRRVARMRPRVERIADELLERLPGLAGDDGVVDLIPHFANALPAAVLSEMVGIPERDKPRWHEWYAVVSPVADGRRKAAAWREMVPYAKALIERRRADPGDDLVSAMISAQDEDGNRLSEVEMIAMMVMLGLTGPQTNATFIGNGLLALLTHPEQAAVLRENPDLMPRAVEELLRWCGPTHVVPRMRYAAEDVEIGGVRVRKGEAVWIVLAGANYDPHRFDDPERLDITRERPDRRGAAHVAFGGGAHHCLAAAQARQDAEVAFAAVLRRLPGLTLAVDPSELEREPMPFQWRLRRLPVRL
jgi:cytochrome P450